MTTSHHPGAIEQPGNEKARLEQRLAFARERVYLAHEAVKEAEQDHLQALAALEQHKGEGVTR